MADESYFDGRFGLVGPDDLVTSFVFVPHGCPEPAEWMAEHPGWVKFPATLVPRGSGYSLEPSSTTTAMGAALGTTAAAAAGPVLLEGLAEGAAIGAVGVLAAFAAAVGVALYPSSTASREMDEVPLQEREEFRRRAQEGFHSAPPIPPLPGFVPPAEDRPLSGTGGFTPGAPTARLPGFDQAAPHLPVLPGRTAEEHGPTIFRQDRNDRLGGGAKTNSRRAREAARAADPAVTEALHDAEWRAHHLINLAGVRAAPELMAEAARAGWRTDDAGNVAPLPATADAQRKLRAAGIDRPVHDSGHLKWNAEVVAGLKRVKQELQRSGLRPGSEARARLAREELERLQHDLRQKMLDLGRMTQNGLLNNGTALAGLNT